MPVTDDDIRDEIIRKSLAQLQRAYQRELGETMAKQRALDLSNAEAYHEEIAKAYANYRAELGYSPPAPYADDIRVPRTNPAIYIAAGCAIGLLLYMLLVLAFGSPVEHRIVVPFATPTVQVQSPE
jgi:hypothetical protein